MPIPGRKTWESQTGLAPASPSEDSQNALGLLRSFLQLRSRPDASSLAVLPLLLLSILFTRLFRSPEVTAGCGGKSLFFRAGQAVQVPVATLTDCVTLSESLHLFESPVLCLQSEENIIHLQACEHLCRLTGQVITCFCHLTKGVLAQCSF